MYAIIEDSGRQFKVTSGDRINIDREIKEGDKTVTFDRILLVAGEGTPKIGAPLVAKATVIADIIGPVKGPKIDIVKYKRRKGYSHKAGHRQPSLQVKVTDINV